MDERRQMIRTFSSTKLKKPTHFQVEKSPNSINIRKPTKAVSPEWHEHFAGSGYWHFNRHNGLDDHIFNPHHQCCKPITLALNNQSLLINIS